MGADHYELLTTKEACRFLRVSPSTLYRMEKDGHVYAYRTPGGQRRFSRKVLESYLERSRGRAPAWPRKREVDDG